jgi:hypothetical protein
MRGFIAFILLLAACKGDAQSAPPDAPAPDARPGPDAPAPDAGAPDAPPNPQILEVLVLADEPPPDPLFDTVSGYALAFGTVPAFDLCPGGGCPTTGDGVALACAQSGALAGHCVQASTGTIPVPAHARTGGAAIRVVVSDLLDGKTLEHFVCACQGDSLLDLDPARCAGAAFSDDPLDCAACGAPSAGHCLDTDMNGIADLGSLRPGVAHLRCGAGVTATSTPVPACPGGWSGGTSGTCSSASAEGDGFYFPSGDQTVPEALGLEGLGPAIVIKPRATLPAGADCTIAIDASVRNRLGLALDPPATTPVFHTAP